MRRPFSAIQRWPLLTDAGTRPATSHARVLSAAGALVLVALALALRVLPLAPRLMLFGLALGLFAAATLRRRPARRTSGAAIVADPLGLSRTTLEGTKRLVDWGTPFGVTLLASYGRPQGLLAFTTPTQARYIPVRIDGRSDADDDLFARIAVLADLDLVDGASHHAALTAEDAAALVRHAAGRDEGALGRVFLSDGRGVPIALDRATLEVGGRTFDLSSHIEWRPLMFHESTGQAAALYQATWIRQSGAEVVLVAPMPASIVPREPSAHREATGRLGRALTRDLRLLQAPSETPPARDVRVAIDRPFMMVVRRVLDEAPLAARVALPPAKGSATQGRDSVA
jgi:hypothetical protein